MIQIDNVVLPSVDQWKAVIIGMSRNKGVRQTNSGKFEAYVTVKGNFVSCGTYKTEEEARDILKQNIRTANHLDEDNYTADSWSAFKTVLAEATTVANSYSSTADEINAVNDKLIDAMTALVTVSDDTSTLMMDDLGGIL